jgi:hypothetical protein
MRWIPFLAAALGLGLGCHKRKPSTNVTPAACQGLTGPSVPFDTARVRELAGTYDVALVDTISVPRHLSVRVGRLRLWPQDSIRSLRGPFSGWWQADLGIAIMVDPKGRTDKPGGYFRARRVG